MTDYAKFNTVGFTVKNIICHYFVRVMHHTCVVDVSVIRSCYSYIGQISYVPQQLNLQHSCISQVRLSLLIDS